MRYAYVKNGNVIEELESIGPNPETQPTSGPTTFAGSYLHMVGKNPALLVSYGLQNDVRIIGQIEARTYRRPSGIFLAINIVEIAGKLMLKLVTFKPHVVICVQGGIGLWVSYLACRITSTPFIHSRQRAIKVKGDSWGRRMATLFDGFVLRRATAVICHGPFTRSQLLEVGVDESKIIEFDVKFDDSMFAEQGAPIIDAGEQGRKHSRILFLGRVEESKGIFELLEACSPMLESPSEVELVYVGDGDALEKLRQQVKKQGLEKQVFFAGRIPHAEIGTQLREATALVTPTRFGLEGRCMTALEGMAMGVPVIAPDAGPFPSLIRDGYNGLLYQADSVCDLRDKIEKVISNPDLRKKLSDGALKSEQRRSKSMISFGEALKLACERATSLQ